MEDLNRSAAVVWLHFLCYDMNMERSDAVVGRAELKLAGAVKAFGYDFRGKNVLDIGSSTGGFTELALRRGARKVVAVEKGTKQMKVPLRYDPRIVLMEKTDIFTVKAEDILKIEVVLADVSFVSLKKVLHYVKKNVVSGQADWLVMLKPQFEAFPDQLVNGVVKNERMRREIVQNFEVWLRRNGFVVVKKRDNELRGKVGGNLERFYWLKTQ